ncbi:MAG TPA: EthD family reductase [Actinomycetota bacterium]|nr:EthD family reductase [Actinomycetota bacterium]
MVKIIAIWKKPEDTEAFEKHYTEIHIPLAKKMPGVRKIEIHRARRALVGGEDVYAVVELHFDDRQAMRAALESEAGMATGADAHKLSNGTIQLIACETEEVSV